MWNWNFGNEKKQMMGIGFRDFICFVNCKFFNIN